MDLVTVTPRVPGPGETVEGSSFSTFFGGKGANQAVAAARLLRQSSEAEPEEGMAVKMTGAVGDDQFGRDFLEHLSTDERLDIRDVEVKTGFKTGTSVILVEEHSGENRILFTKGANGELAPSIASMITPSAQEHRHFVVLQMETPIETVVACVEAAKASRKEVILNPAPAVPLPERLYKGLDHLVVNESEAAIFSGISEANIASSLDHVKECFLNKGVKNVIVTLGSEGAYYGNNASSETIASKKVKPVDTTAGGDTFVGALAVYFAKHGSNDLAAAVSFANLVAATSVTRAGAQASMPFAGELS